MRIKHSERDPNKLPERSFQAWELVNGHMRLYISGPGMKAWFPVTAPCSASTIHGTPQERSIARRALLKLARRFHNTTEATVHHIREALEHYGWTPDPHTLYPTDNDSRGDDPAIN